MEAEDPLSQLADIHLPGTVPFWPPAPGWWLLAAILLAAGLWLGYRYYRTWQEQQRLKRVLGELEVAMQGFRQAQQDPPQLNREGLALLYAVNSLLKRVALVRHPDADVASLTGEDWLAFLDDTGSGHDFSRGPGKVLADGEYRPRFDADSEALYDCARRWIIDQYRHTRQQSPAGAAA